MLRGGHEVVVTDEQSRDAAAALFRGFAIEASGGLGAPLYSVLAPQIADSNEVLSLALQSLQGQPAPNMLFAAVQYLLEKQPDHELASWYPRFGGQLDPEDVDPFPAFHQFCIQNQQEIRELLGSHRVQTNEVMRSTGLVVALGELYRQDRRPIELIDLGASAGLNLNFDLYSHHLGDQSWGAADSAVTLAPELRGPHQPPFPSPAQVEARWGIDLHPVDVRNAGEARWLRALVYPEHTDRLAMLDAAMSVATAHPPEIVEGDLAEVLGDRLADVPGDRAVCLLASFVLHQLSVFKLDQLWSLLEEASRGRELTTILVHGYRDDPGGAIRLLRFADGERTRRKIADFNPHGMWIEYLPSEPEKRW